MASNEKNTLTPPSTSMVKVKRSRKSSLIPMAAGQRCIAASMAKVITRMVNTNLQSDCMAMLQIDDLNDVEGQIREILQNIDTELMEEKWRKEKAKIDRMSKKK